MEIIYTQLALYGSKNECARTNTVFLTISEDCNGTVSLCVGLSSWVESIEREFECSDLLYHVCFNYLTYKISSSIISRLSHNDQYFQWSIASILILFCLLKHSAEYIFLFFSIYFVLLHRYLYCILKAVEIANQRFCQKQLLQNNFLSLHIFWSILYVEELQAVWTLITIQKTLSYCHIHDSTSLCFNHRKSTERIFCAAILHPF